MKKLLLITLLLMPLMVMAETTTDRIVAAAATTLQPGGSEVKVQVSLDGTEHIYTGYEMDITLPEGVELNYYKGSPDVSMTKNGGIYPVTEDRDGNISYTHSISVSYGAVGANTVRVTCHSSKNEDFVGKSGKLFTMYLKATPFAKPGNVQLALSNCKLATYNKSTLTVTGYTPLQTAIEGVSVGNSGTMAVRVNNTVQWGTCMLPFDSSLPGDMKAYSCSSHDSDYLLLTPVQTMKAFTPYIVYSESGIDQSLTGTIPVADYPADGSVAEGFLHASTVPVTITEGYVLQKQNGEVKFYKVNSGSPIAIPAGKCWVTIPDALLAKGALGFAIDNGTAVPTVTASPTTGTTIHTLDGLQARQMQKGRIYINKGKKFTR